MHNKVIFVDGLNVFKPNENAPEWIKANMVINPTQLVKWLEQNDQYLKEGKRGLELRLEIKQSAQGKLYAAVDTFEPKLKEEVTSKQPVVEEEGDLPF